MTNDLAQTIKDVIAVSNSGMQTGYEAGRAQGFHDGIKAAADLLLAESQRYAHIATESRYARALGSLSNTIRELRP